MSFHPRLLFSCCMTFVGFLLHQLVELFEYARKSKTGSMRSALADANNPGCIESETIVPAIHRLPAELVAEVFLQLIRTSQLDIVNQRHGIWVLSNTCSRWRSIVHSSPTLWSTIIIRESGCELHPQAQSGDSDCSCEVYPQAHFILELFLTRSGSCPLSVEYYSASRSHSLLSMLARYSYRWKKVTLHMRNSLYLSLNGAIGQLPLLEELQLYFTSHYSHSRNLHVDAFQNAPRLRALRLLNWPYNPAQSLSCPWYQLTSYSNSSPEGLEDVLVRMPNLVNLQVNGYVAHPSKAILILPHLRQLIVRADTMPAFHRVVMPNLEELSLLHTRYISTCRLLWILCYAEPRYLQALSIDYLGEGLICPLLSFLRSCPTLRTITITSWSPAQMARVLDVLTISSDEKTSCVAPRLEVIDFRSCMALLFLPFLEMVESRWRPNLPLSVSPLRKVNIHLSATSSTSILFPRLEVLKREGLDISLR